jgi:hypothetical protein
MATRGLSEAETTHHSYDLIEIHVLDLTVKPSLPCDAGCPRSLAFDQSAWKIVKQTCVAH